MNLVIKLNYYLHLHQVGEMMKKGNIKKVSKKNQKDEFGTEESEEV